MYKKAQEGKAGEADTVGRGGIFRGNKIFLMSVSLNESVKDVFLKILTIIIWLIF